MSAQKELENYSKSIQYSIDQAKASLQELATDILDSKVLKGIVDIFTIIIQCLDKIIDHPLIALLLGGGTAGVVELFRGGKDIANILAPLTKLVETGNTLSRISDVVGKAYAGTAIEVDMLSAATKSLTLEQTAQILSLKGLNKEQIKEILMTKVSSAEDLDKVNSLMAEIGATNGLTFSLKGLNVALAENIKLLAAWLVTNPIGWAVLVAGAIAGTIAIFDVFTESLDEQKEKYEEISQEAESAKSKLESLESELSSINNQIKELQSKGTLTLSEQDDLNRLISERENLELMASAQERIAQAKAREQLYANTKVFSTEYNNSQYVNGGMQFANEYVENKHLLEQYQKNRDEWQRKLDEENSKGSDANTKRLEKYKDKIEELNEEIDNLTGGYFNQKELELLELKQQFETSGDGYENKVINGVKYQDVINQLKEIKTLTGTTGEWNEMQISSVVDKLGLTDEQLQKLAKTGVDSLNSVEGLTKAISDADLIIEDGETTLGLFNKFLADYNNNVDSATASTGQWASVLSSELKKLDMSEEDFNKLVESIKALNPELANNQIAAEKAALANIKFDKAVSDLSSSFDDYKKAIKKGDRLSVKYNETVTNMKDNLTYLTGVDFNLIDTDEWLNDTKNINLLEEALNGSEDALEQIRKSAQDKIVIDIQTKIDELDTSTIIDAYNTEKLKQSKGKNGMPTEVLEIDAELNTDDFDAEFNSLLNWMENSDLGIIEATATLDDAPFMSTLVAMASQSSETAKAIQALFAALGWDMTWDLKEMPIINPKGSKVTYIPGTEETVHWDMVKADVPTNIKFTKAGSTAGNTKATTPKSIGSSGGSGGGGGSSSEPKEETYDWIETKIQRIEREITNLDKIVNRTWISWSDRNKALADELSKVEEEIGVQESAYERYMTEANSVGLSEDYAEKVKNGLIDLETITDETLKSQIDGYKGYYEQALSASDSVEDLRDKIYDLLKLDFDNVIKRWNIELEKFQHNLDIHNTAWDGLSDIRKVTPDMIHDNYYVQRVNLSEQIGKKETEITEMTAKRNAMIVRGITGEALDEIDAEIRNAQKELVEYTTEYAKQTAQIYIDLFENVQNKFDEIVNDIDHTSAKLKSYQSINEAAGYATSSYLLERLRDEADGIVYQKQEELIALKQQLEEAVSTGAIEEGSKEWYEMANAIEKVKEEELEAIATSADLTKQLRELDWAKFDEVKTAIEKVKSDNDFLIELLQAETESFEENGSFNNVSNSVLALRSANLQVFKSDADYLKNEIDKYEKMLAENPGDQTLRHHLQDLKDELQDVTKSFKEERQAIIDYWKEHYDTMQKYLDKLINKRKEYLQNEKDIYDYQKNVSKQADDIASIQKQLMAYSGDETEEGKAKRQKLQKSLEDAQEQLEETEYERWKQDQETMLDKLSEDFGDYVETTMKDTNGLIENTNILITENSDTISKTIQGVVNGNNNKITGPLAGIETALSTGTFGYNYTNVLGGINSVLGTIAQRIQDEYDLVNQKSKIDEERVNDSEKAPINAPRTTNSMYRLYDPNSGSHFYTTDQNERDRLISSGWTDEGELGKAFENGAIPISRLFNPNNGDHLYTINSNEVDALKNAGWSYEGTIGYASDDDSGEPVYRLYNPNTGLHNFTMDENERDYLRSLGWVDEDVAWKMARFAKGGELVKGTGEDGFVLGRAGEHILSLDQIKEMKGVMKAYNPLAEAIKGVTGISGLVGNSVDSMAITFNLPNVTNYNEFQNALKNDPDFYNWMAEATVGQLAGHNSLSRYKF